MATKTEILEGTDLAEAIEEESEQQVIDRLGFRPAIWYTGGSDHNDYRLSAEQDPQDERKVIVRDTSGCLERVRAMSESDVEEYVKDWLDATMTDED